MFKNILCATDLSPRSHAALQKAVQMAAAYEAKLTVLNVHEEFMDKDEMVMLRVSVEHMQEHFRDIAVHAREEMKSLVTATGIDDVSVNYLLREGKAADTIIKTAEIIAGSEGNFGNTLIVVGSNGKESLREIILGSVAETVVRHSPVPVLVIPHMRG